MIKSIVYQTTPFLSEGYQLPDLGINNGTAWLRGAVNHLYNRNKGRLRKAGVATSLFHNHNEQSGNTIARYPLIQYQRWHNDFFLAGFNQGGDTLKELFAGLNPTCEIDNYMLLKVKKVFDREQQVAATGCSFRYTITDWLPFNRVNYTQYKNAGALTKKTKMLEHILKSHIVNDFSRFLALGFTLENTVVKILSCDSFTRSCVQLKVNKHTHDFQPFTLVFESNLLLPQYICLGNGKVYGFGLVKPVSD